MFAYHVVTDTQPSVWLIFAERKDINLLGGPK